MSTPRQHSSSVSSPSTKRNGKAAATSTVPSQTPAPLPAADDRNGWRAYWRARGQPWRTEPEINQNRQAELEQRRAIVPDIEKGIYPFKEIKLCRADIEWLLATHENGRGPVNWSDESQRERSGLDLRGADLSQGNLKCLPLARLRGGLTWDEWVDATKEQRSKAVVLMQEASVRWCHLEGANLREAHLEGADLREAYLEGAKLRWAYLGDADLRGAYLEEAHLRGVSLKGKMYNCPRLADVHWSNVNLSLVKWSQVNVLGDEQKEGEAKEERFESEITERTSL